MKLPELLRGSPEAQREAQRRREISEIDANTFMAMNRGFQNGDGSRIIPNAHDTLPMALPGELVIDLTDDELLTGLDIGILSVYSISQRQLAVYAQAIERDTAKAQDLAVLQSLLTKVSKVK